MPTTPPNPSKLSELTVTCHQCGSAAMERLDAKEYRCKHCGAITIVSDDDSERLEALLTKVLNRSAPAQPARPGSTVQTADQGRSWMVGLALMAIFAIFVLVSILTSPSGHHSSSTASRFDNDTVRPEQIAISPLQVEESSSSSSVNYTGMIYNHSGYAIDVPDYTLTFYPNGMKGDSTRSSVDLDRLLPGEYEPISFDSWKRNLGARYEIQAPTRVNRNTDDIARPELTQSQLVHHVGSGYELVGIVQNTFTRPIESMDILVMFYGPNNQLIGSDHRSLNSLNPGEKDAVHLSMQKDDVEVTAYEYLINANYGDKAR